MTNNSVPYAAIVSVDTIEEEQTRIFTKAFFAEALRDDLPEPEAVVEISSPLPHRFIAISIPAFLDDEGADEATPSLWWSVGKAVAVGSAISMIGVALIVAYAG